MSRLKVKLNRNLRRSIMRGHPWVYKESLVEQAPVERAQLCQVLDPKGELAWAMYDPHGPLSLRILSTDKTPPNLHYFEKLFTRALNLRSSIKTPETNAYRLFNGEGDLVPGLVCDVYDSVAIIQFDGLGPSEFWDKKHITKWLLENSSCKTVMEKTRRNTDKTIEHLGGEACNPEIVVKENGVLFKVNLVKGQKTGFFLDQRDNRKYVGSLSKDKNVLNLFSYSGGFSVYAGLGGAKKVTSVDIAIGAITLAQENWELNGLKSSTHNGVSADVFEFLKSEKELWDHIIVDPPSMSHSESQKTLAKAKYIEIFSAAAQHVSPQGQLSLSSCSSHISFEDFFEIITETLSQARRRGQILRVSGQGLDHPFPQAAHELRYLKYMHLALD